LQYQDGKNSECALFQKIFRHFSFGVSDLTKVQFEAINHIINDISLRFVVNIDEAFYALLVDKMR